MPGEAARIALASLCGKQDTYLVSKAPKDSPFFFDGRHLSHSNFRKYHRSKTVYNPGTDANWPFGQQSIKVRFDPMQMGDLLTNMWVRITMPGLASTDDTYADQLGRHIFKEVRMRVDEVDVETFYDDWGMIYDELYLEMSEKVANRFLVNRSLAYDSSDLNSTISTAETELLIPLNFFFSRKYSGDEYSQNEPDRPYFPVCSCYKQKIEFEFVFHKQTFFTDTSKTLTVPKFHIITEEITLEPEERMYFMKNAQTLVTDLVYRHPSAQTEKGKTNLRTNLVPDQPVKVLHWFFRNSKFEDENITANGETEEGESYTQNRFNFSSNVNFDQTYSFFAPVMDEAKFYLNGEKFPNSTQTGHLYYKYLTPMRRYLSRPYRNIYTHSFAEFPRRAQFSGHLDFSQLKGNKTAVEFSFEPLNAAGGSLLDIDVYSMHMYYVGYEVFVFEGGKMRKLLQSEEKPVAEENQVQEEEDPDQMPEPRTGPMIPKPIYAQTSALLNKVKRLVSM